MPSAARTISSTDDVRVLTHPPHVSLLPPCPFPTSPLPPSLSHESRFLYLVGFYAGPASRKLDRSESWIANREKRAANK